MRGLVPRIHVFVCRSKDVMAGTKAGYDDKTSLSARNAQLAVIKRESRQTSSMVRPLP
jgi:hypothetical protein